MSGTLQLADGSKWVFGCGNESARNIVSRLNDAFCLDSAQPLVLRMSGSPALVLVVFSDERRGFTPVWRGIQWVEVQSTQGFVSHAGSSSGTPTDIGGFVVHCPDPGGDRDSLAIQMMYVSLLISTHSESLGGVLLHGALAEWNGRGVVLAGPGNIGKTTASRRLPSPWCALCDDTTLVVRDAKGTYWAHPWPTWSQYMFGGPGGSWDTGRAVPLKGVFFITQDDEDHVERIGLGRALAMMNEVAEQASSPILSLMEVIQARLHRVQRFDNIRALVGCVPAYRLRLSLTGAFWEEIERVIGGDRAP